MSNVCGPIIKPHTVHVIYKIKRPVGPCGPVWRLTIVNKDLCDSSEASLQSLFASGGLQRFTSTVHNHADKATSANVSLIQTGRDRRRRKHHICWYHSATKPGLHIFRPHDATCCHFQTLCLPLRKKALNRHVALLQLCASLWTADQNVRRTVGRS